MDDARQKLVRDARLMRRVADGDRRARLDLVKALWPRVANMARHMSPFADEVDDLTQEALLQILGSAPRFQADGCLEAWADVIAVRTILRHLRRIHRSRRLFVPETTEPTGDGEDGEATYLRKARAECVSALLHRLPADQRVALVLKLIQGHSVDEVSRLMGKSVPNVRYLLRKGRAKVRRLATRDAQVRELFPWSGSC